jgi:hypothetical protein
LGLLDLSDMGDRVKNMDIVSSSQGNFFFFKSLQENDRSLTIQMLEQVLFELFAFFTQNLQNLIDSSSFLSFISGNFQI